MRDVVHTQRKADGLAQGVVIFHDQNAARRRLVRDQGVLASEVGGCVCWIGGRIHRLALVLQNFALFCYRLGDVGARRVDINSVLAGYDDEVHVFHRDRSKKGLVAHDQRAGEAASIFELDSNRPAIGYGNAAPIGDGDFAPLEFFEVQLNRDVLGQAEMDGAGVNKTVDVNRLKFGPNRIGKPKRASDDAHWVLS
jgi:hypothetical protein